MEGTPRGQERELNKLASLAAALADALRRRGVPNPAAELTGDAGIAVFRVAFERWVHDDSEREFARFVDEGSPSSGRWRAG